MLAHVLLSMSVVLLVTKSAESGPAINHFILNKIEAMRSEMPNGLYGGPPLVPLQYDNLDIDYDRDNVTVSGVLQNVQVENLNEFEVDTVDFDMNTRRLNITFTLPKVRVTGDYNINSVLDDVELNGVGPFEMIAHNAKLIANLRLNIIGGQLNVIEFVPTLLMDAVTSNFEGIMGGDGSNEMFNEVIEQILPLLLESHKEEVSESIADLVVDPVNKELSTMKLMDMMHEQNLLVDHNH